MRNIETRVNNATLVFFLLGITLIFFLLIWEYALPLFYAAVLAGLSRPVNHWFQRKLKGKTILSAVMTIVVTLLLIVIPLSVLVFLLGRESVSLGFTVGEWLKQNESIDEGVSGVVSQIPLIDHIFPNHTELDHKIHDIIQKISQVLVASLVHAFSDSAQVLVKSIITFFLFFYFVVDGENIQKKIISLIPMRQDYKDELFGRFLTVTWATLKGAVFVGIVQGVVGGLSLVVVGIPHAILWGFLIGVFSLIPSIGNTVIWLPAAIYLFVEGHTISAIGLVLFSLLILGNIDNVLRPILVGKDTNLPDLLIFLSTIGGLSVFGINGIIIGPLIAAIFVTLWQMYEETYHELLGRVSQEVPPPDVIQEQNKAE